MRISPINASISENDFNYRCVTYVESLEVENLVDLLDCAPAYDITKLKDHRGYNLLHIAAFAEADDILRVLLKHVSLSINNQGILRDTSRTRKDGRMG